jgi:AcrR family transcriptional regulator
MDDLRIIRTKKIIKQSLIELLNTKRFDSLTVNDISKLAMINRSTFYRHFNDKYDLLLVILQESMEEMMKDIGSVEENLIIFNSDSILLENNDPLIQKNLEILSAFFMYFHKNRKLYKPLLGDNGSMWFSSELKSYLSKFWIHRLKSAEKYYKQTNQYGIISIDIASVWLSHSVVSIIGWWLDNGTDISAETIAKSTLSIIVHGYYKTLGLMNNN